MKAHPYPYGKKLLSLPILLLLTLSLFSAFKLNTIKVSAVESPYIKVAPDSIVDPTLRPGKNYTISMYTDCTNNDITCYQFTLSYDPSILRGVNVTNGDLIVGRNAKFLAGPFDNVAGKLSLTVAFYDVAGDVTSGPGTLAFVTFTVVGIGTSNITIGPETKLYGWNFWEEKEYIIIDAQTMPTHIKHGYFDNRFPHDVAVVSLTTPSKAAVRSFVSINVTVANIGSSDEVVNVTIRYDTTYINSQNVTLAERENETTLFSWDTTGVAQGTYTINVTATIEGDGDPANNWKTTTIFLAEHDIAVVSVIASAKAAVGSLVPISVEVINVGASSEDVKVAVSYDSLSIETRRVALAVGESKTVLFSWNTSSVAVGTYTINATATIEGDLDPTDNWKVTPILLVEHDVSVVSVTAPVKATVGSLVPINVTVANVGASDEDVKVAVSYDTKTIGAQNVTVNKQENTTLQFTWDTKGVAARTYTINVTVTIEGDGDPTDNWKTTTIFLVKHDVAVKYISAPTMVDVGELVTIEVTVENLGGYNETFEVKVTYDTSIIEEPKTVTLLSRVSQTIKFRWNTTGVAPDSYTITAEVILDGDANPSDNRMTKSITVESPFGNIAGTVTDASTGDPIAGTTVTAEGNSATTDANGTYTINNVPLGTHTVTASAAKYVEQSKTVTVAAGTTTHLDFELTLLNGTISGVVTDSSTGNPISGATVTVNSMSATTNSSGVYTISDIQAGTYTVTASAEGYESSVKTNITVVAGETTSVDFELTSAVSAQPLDILLYAGVAAVAIIIIAGITVYIFKVRKQT